MANTTNVISIDQRRFGRKNRGKDPRVVSGVITSAVKKSRHLSSSHQTLNAKQVEKLIDAALQNRHGIRDAAIILMAFDHGLKVRELINLKWEHIDFQNECILVSRLSNGQETLQPLTPRELKLLRELAREDTELVFMSQRKSRMSNLHIRNIIKHAGEQAGFEIPVYPSMLSGATGFNLADAKSRETATTH